MRSATTPPAATVPAVSLFASLYLASGVFTPVRADLIQYWPLNETGGIVAPNSVAAGTQGDLFNGATWVTDEARGQVLEFDGIDGVVSAGAIPPLADTDNFTWSVWTNSAQAANNNIMIGNRYPDGGWCKLTTAAFELRDLTPTFNATIDYPDFAAGTWVHHTVTKNGPLLTYFRNGVATGSNWLALPFPGAPFYMGGDMFEENWAGRLDDVAQWSNALPTGAVIGLAQGTFTPLTAPATFTPPAVVEVLKDDFSGTLQAWTVTDRGLESNGPAGYDAPAIVNGQLVLGGTSSQQYWYGTSLESTTTFDSRLYTEVSVNRLSLTGVGLAYRSSLWILGDDGHYLHFSHNAGETGWSTNARDDGGTGTANAIGGGNNLTGLDALDGDLDPHVMSLRLLPLTAPGAVNIEVLLDGVVHGVYGFTNFPTRFRVILSGQARAAADSVSAVFDDLTVKQPEVDNFAPSFSATSYALPSATTGTAYSQTIASNATDTENNPLTFSKTDGPDWVSVSAAGVISGTPPAGTEALARVVVNVTDNIGGNGGAVFSFRVETPAAEPPLFGWWPLNETDGDIAADASGQGLDATVMNQASGGLDADFSAWIVDPEFGNVLSFEGTDVTGACATVGSPPTTGTLPLLDATSKFTWAFWCKPVIAPTTDIILGDRYDPSGVDYAPQEFIKFTGLSFEWRAEGVGEDLDYPDMPLNEWTHNAIVKDGNVLLYYRNGQFLQGRTITRFPVQNHGIYFAGQNLAVEAWRGSMSDVRLFNGALSDAGIRNLFENRNATGSANFVAISSVVRAADGAVTITFPTEAEKTYIVEGSTGLNTWVQVGANAASPFTLAAGNTTLNPATEPRLFLRVKQTN